MVATDEQLLAAYLDGDASAFALLVHRYERDLFRFLRRFIGDAAAAEDVFQDAFLQVHQSAKKFDLTKSFRPWLFTIAANKARDLMRSRARRRTMSIDTPIDRDGLRTVVDALPSDVTGPEECAETDELRRRIIGVVDALPASQREVVLLAYFHQFPYRQIAEMLNLPLGTVKSRLHVATKAFAASWGKLNAPAQIALN
jgi:RNA polymerase sigma-70 factor (ECF subfamily)